MYYYDFYYPKDNTIFYCKNNYNLNFFTFPQRFNKNPYGFLNFNIFSSDKKIIDNALISVFILNNSNLSNIRIDAPGYNPVFISNVLINSCMKNNYNIYMMPLNGKINYNNTKSTNVQNIPDNSENVENSENSQNEIRNLTFLLGTDTPASLAFAEKFAEETSNLSNGKIKIQINPNIVVENNIELIKSLKQYGFPHFIIQYTAPHITSLPKLSVFDMPMVYSDINKLRDVIDNEEFYFKISNIYNEGGFKLLGIGDQLFREMTSNKEIKTEEDFVGLRIRTLQNHNHEAFWELLGATIIPLPVSEIYYNIKSGIIDAQENPYENIVGLKLYELQKYVINTCHLPHITTLITSNEIFNSLNQSEKAIIEEAAKRAVVYERETADKRSEELKNFLTDNGMTILELPEETRQFMIQSAAPVYENIRKIVDDDELINLYLGNI